MAGDNEAEAHRLRAMTRALRSRRRVRVGRSLSPTVIRSPNLAISSGGRRSGSLTGHPGIRNRVRIGPPAAGPECAAMGGPGATGRDGTGPLVSVPRALGELHADQVGAAWSGDQTCSGVLGGHEDA
jgi:hypothetical protein